MENPAFVKGCSTEWNWQKKSYAYAQVVYDLNLYMSILKVVDNFAEYTQWRSEKINKYDLNVSPSSAKWKKFEIFALSSQTEV